MRTFREDLVQWATLEPDQCRNHDGLPSFLLQDDFWTIPDEPTECDLALLLSRLLLAVDRQGLRVRLENDAESWYVDLRHPDDPHWACNSIGTIDEAAQTLLAAYVSWLEKNITEKSCREAAIGESV